MSGGNNQGEPTFVLLMMVVLLGGLGWLVWHATHEFWLHYVFRWMRFGELWIINLFTHRYGACLDWIRLAPINTATPASATLARACFGNNFINNLPANEQANYFAMSMPALVALGGEASRYYRWPAAIILVYIGLHTLLFSPRNKFMTKHTLESLIQTQAKMWPIISPIVKFNPSKFGRILGDPVPDKLPVFAEALSPEEWVSWNRIPIVNGIPDRDATRRAFIRQLGPRWSGVESLPIHMRALMAAFALKGLQRRDESDTMLGKLALAWSVDKGFRPDGDLVKEINDLLRDKDISAQLKTVTDNFAWRTTAILGVLRWARALGGVLAPAQFIWIRGEDRAIWYPLNNLGRRSFHSEGAGALAHFMAEEAAKKPLPIPRVDTAIVTLNTYLHDPDKRPVPIPPRENAKA